MASLERGNGCSVLVGRNSFDMTQRCEMLVVEAYVRIYVRVQASVGLLCVSDTPQDIDRRAARRSACPQIRVWKRSVPLDVIMIPPHVTHRAARETSASSSTHRKVH